MINIIPEVGKIYYIKSCGHNWILRVAKVNEPESKVYSIARDVRIFLKKGIPIDYECGYQEWGIVDENTSIRLATPLEEEWLNLCIKADTLVPKPKAPKEVIIDHFSTD